MRNGQKTCRGVTFREITPTLRLISRMAPEQSIFDDWRFGAKVTNGRFRFLRMKIYVCD